MSGDKLDGIGAYTRALLRAFDEDASLQVHAVPASYSPPLRFRRPRSDFARGRFFPFSFVPSLVAARATGLPFAGSAAIEADIDLFHSTDYRVPRLRRVPVVATLCDAIPVKYPQWCSGGPLAYARAAALRLAAQNADHVIAISQAAVADLVEAFGIAPERISVVHLGVDPAWFARADAARRAQVQSKYRLPPRFVLAVGTLQPRKNLQTTLAAHRMLARRAQAPLVVVGQPGWNSDALVAALRSEEAQGHARWLGYVDQADLPVLYQLAAVFVLASLYEGFGLPVLEAFASGTPVVASNTTALPEVAGDAALLAAPTDAAALAAALTRLLDDDDLANDLRRRGLVRAHGYSWQRCARETRAVYERVLAPAAVPGAASHPPLSPSSSPSSSPPSSPSSNPTSTPSSSTAPGASAGISARTGR